MDVRFGKWLLRREPDCWMLGEPVVRGDRKAERIDRPRYYGKLYQALQALVELELGESDATTIGELMQAHRNICARIEAELLPAVLTEPEKPLPGPAAACQSRTDPKRVSRVG